MQETIKRKRMSKLVYILISSSGFFVGYLSKDLWGLPIFIISFLICSWIIDYFVCRITISYNERHPDKTIIL